MAKNSNPGQPKNQSDQYQYVEHHPRFEKVTAYASPEKADAAPHPVGRQAG